MPIVEPAQGRFLREKTLLIGGGGTGKTTAWLSIAWWAFISGDTRKFYVLDTDDEAVLQVMNEPRYDGMVHSVNGVIVNEGGNVIIHSAYEWTQYQGFSDKMTWEQSVASRAVAGDWIILDFVTHAWSAAQEGYLHDASEKTRGSVLYEAGVAGKSGWDMFSQDFNWNCVDPETEILTRRGWKKYNELLVGEDVLGLDPSTWTSRWEPLRAINVSPIASHNMVHLRTRIHDSMSTLDHRWPNFVPEGSRSNKKPWTTTETMPYGHRITTAAPHRNDNGLPKYSDAFVEVAAWYWNEGNRQVNRQGKPSACIFQSLKNSDNCARIRRSLELAFPGHWKEIYFHETSQMFRIWLDASESLFEVFEDTKVKNPTYLFLSLLTESQVQLFIDVCIRADGHERKDGGGRVWTQKDEESVRRFEYVCALAGIATRTRLIERDGTDSFGKDVFSVRLLKVAATTPIQASKMKRYPYQRRAIDYGHSGRDEVQHHGIVWCPTLDSQIWLARRNGTVYYTGNSINGSYFDFIKPILLMSRAHVFMAAEEGLINENANNLSGDQKDHLAMWGKFQAVGQKKLAYQCRSYLRTQRLARGRVLYTMGKDRARQEFNGATIEPDFFKTYYGAAGWTVTDPE